MIIREIKHLFETLNKPLTLNDNSYDEARSICLRP